MDGPPAEYHVLHVRRLRRGRRWRGHFANLRRRPTMAPWGPKHVIGAHPDFAALLTCTVPKYGIFHGFRVLEIRDIMAGKYRKTKKFGGMTRRSDSDRQH